MTVIKPTAGRVLIEPIRIQEVTSSGLVLPDSAQTLTQEAIVVAVGKDIEDVKVGDRVIYSMYGGTKLEYDGKEYLVMQMADLICVVG